MESKKMNYTAAGFKALTDELDYLRNVRREEVKADIAKARSYGDLSENSEYDEAKNEQAKVETRIAELEEMINNAHVVDESEMDFSVVNVGTQVKVANLTLNREANYHIVGSYEADPFKGKISDVSPIGRALIGAKKGDTVVAELPNGNTVKLKVLEIELAGNPA